jgi:small neutral amino acid transporter SnatA (MarC family)
VSDELIALIGVVAALNPAAAALAAGGRIKPTLAGLATGIAAALLLAAALLAEPIMDLLSTTPESFRVANGAVMIISAAHVAIFSRRASTVATAQKQAIHPLALPALAGPAVFTTAMSTSATETMWLAVLGVVIAVAVGGAALLIGPRAGFGTAARFIAALLVVLGVGEIVDGVKSV